MKRVVSTFPVLIVLSTLLLSACSGIGQAAKSASQAYGTSSGAAVSTTAPLATLPAGTTSTQAPLATLPPATASGAAAASTPVIPNTGNSQQATTGTGLLAEYQSTLENLYTQVNPSVVNINVVLGASAGQNGQGLLPGLPNIPGLPNNPNIPDQGQGGQALASGFVWDQQGTIVTNNHVVDGATNIEVTFADGTTVPAKVVGTDVYSDLAVIKVDNVPADKLHPVTMGDSTQVKVGQIVIAIGNPFGLAGTMTTGIVSALQRSLPVGEGQLQTGPTYSIPDVIQTDAPINPGNSGGVLINDQGQVIGVTSAIESGSGSNSGIGFAIPSAMVQKEVPVLIKTGTYQHSYLGISGTSLTPDLAQAMNLNPAQRGALVEEVTPGGPAANAGLQPSTQQAAIAGQQATVGGDVIIAVDGQPIQSMDDLIAYLTGHTTVGQKVTLTILRNGKQMDVPVTLAARPSNPSQTATQAPLATLPSQTQTAGRPWLGIQALPVDAAIAGAMNLNSGQQGILVEQVVPGSPAEKAGLRAGTQQVNDNGQQVTVGGDIITAIDNQPVSQVTDLSSYIQQAGAGKQVTLTVLRNGQQIQVPVTLGTAPAQNP